MYLLKYNFDILVNHLAFYQFLIYFQVTYTSEMIYSVMFWTITLFKVFYNWEQTDTNRDVSDSNPVLHSLFW